MTVSEKNGTILWLTGWGISDSVFNRLRESLPDYHHVAVDYSEVDTHEKMIHLTEMAAKNIQHPLIIGGWSLGGLLALKLAVLADGLLLFAASARFTRPKEESARGWADAYVRLMIAGLSKDREAVETKFRRMMFTEAEREEGIEQRIPSRHDWTTPALIAGLQILREEEVLTQLQHIRCPVFLVHGTKDTICPFGAALELVSLVPQANLHTIPLGGHAPFLGREEEIAKRFRSWWHEQSNNSN
ncbi:alpha/beta fold hydrolase [Paenibacillus lupini]|uniref:alpha/beta fold hydrolase n=1 Tax=Paenibacillus lupini TaxID=1450204 RepID=UPI00141E1829|nr:alpha/beta fold hydrolase [Paenibacillus lupini]NIK21966.1 pimeloyl-[acyl-carrier protein] methyl ester esterase [Paenibacillus lupini]